MCMLTFADKLQTIPYAVVCKMPSATLCGIQRNMNKAMGDLTNSKQNFLRNWTTVVMPIDFGLTKWMLTFQMGTNLTLLILRD